MSPKTDLNVSNSSDDVVDPPASTNGKAKNKRGGSHGKSQVATKRLRTSTSSDGVVASGVLSTSLPPSDPQNGDHAAPSSQSTLAEDSASSADASADSHAKPPLGTHADPHVQSAIDTQATTPAEPQVEEPHADSQADPHADTPTDPHADRHASPNAHAESHAPQFSDVNYVPHDDLQRLVAFAQKVDEQNNRFAVSRVPASAKWGSSPSTERIYCYNDRPVTYWLLGVVGSKWFTNFKGEPQLRVNIGLRLPYKDDDAFAKKIYKLAMPPKKDEDIPALVYASKYMARQVRGSADAVPMPFKEVYDAQRRFRSKREMSIIPPAYISKNDLVLVEAFLTRWNTAKDKKSKAEWTSWDVSFELQAVSLLFEAPPTVDEHEYGPADNIRDDM